MVSFSNAAAFIAGVVVGIWIMLLLAFLLAVETMGENNDKK